MSSFGRTTMLSVEGLAVNYRKVQALSQVDIHVSNGELVAVVGPNGAGKSTLLRAISRLVPARRGAIRLDGEDISRKASIDLVRWGLLHVPERRQLFDELTVLDNLMIGGDVKSSMAPLEQIYDLFPVLRERRHQIAGSLSGGEQQMLAIGRALMAQPRLLLLDEPSLGLSPKMVTLMLQAIVRLRRNGMTILLVEQNAMQALRIADRAYVINGGRVVLQGAGATLSTSSEIIGAYLGGGP
jgi:branched-chain amino acid transport system ATP-binding protein